MKLLPILLPLLWLASPRIFAQSTTASQSLPTAEAVLKASIQYHDPKGVWAKEAFQLSLRESRADGSARETTIRLDNKTGAFELSQKREDHLLFRSIKGDQCETKLDGSTEISEEDRKKHRLTCDYNRNMSNYYTYLYGLPMKLRDPGTIIHETIQVKNFQGKELLEIKVTYDPEVGKDTWYFYFDPSSYALKGYRFYHDESKNDGEYITLAGEERIGKLRLPKVRKWYTHQEDKLLGTDELVGDK